VGRCKGRTTNTVHADCEGLDGVALRQQAQAVGGRWRIDVIGVASAVAGRGEHHLQGVGEALGRALSVAVRGRTCEIVEIEAK